MLPECGRIVEEHNENLKELENIKKIQSELKDTVTEIQNTPEGINNRLGDTENAFTTWKTE